MQRIMRHILRGIAPLAGLLLLVPLWGVNPAWCAATPASALTTAGAHSFVPIRTQTPRQTLETFLHIAGELDQMVAEYGLDATSDRRETYDRLILLIDQAGALVDGSLLPEGLRPQVTTATVIYLLDILGRIDLPPLESVPGSGQADIPDYWVLPGTPIRIVRDPDGPREFEYLFSAKTHEDAPRFLRGIDELPLRSQAGVENWSLALSQITGPAIPAAVVVGMPGPLKALWLETPVWKVLLTVVLYLLLLASALLLHRWGRRRKGREGRASMAARSIAPLWILGLLWWLEPLINYQLNISGDFQALFSVGVVATRYIAGAWLLWYAVLAVFEYIARPGSGDAQNADSQMLLLVGKTLALFGVFVVLSTGAQAVGLPVLSIVAGLGVGGLAVALSIRPTLENMIGGIILYLDHPVRVGDFCSFGDKLGTVESIGLRTIKLRGRDRTLITVPNAEFANMELVNWARCDKMLFTSTICLRHETTSDQLRHVLVKVSEMFHAHPKIESQTVRIRLVDIGPSALEVNIRVYALTREWNEFFAIREDVLLRVKDLVHGSGARFAFPAQSVYLSQDWQEDESLRESAVGEVEQWRRSGSLPFPNPSPRRLRELEGSLDWPPRGSVSREWQEPQASEPLSRNGGDGDGAADDQATETHKRRD